MRTNNNDNQFIEKENKVEKVNVRKKFTDGGGKRFNNGKLRYDLVQPKAHEDMVEVLTDGAMKYTERNWERGMSWTTVLQSLKRHIAAFEKGEDFDPESGKLHMAHAACNVHFLNAYYYIYPQGDDRPKRFLNQPHIGLDIDEVLADWVGAWMERYNITARPESWAFDYEIMERFKTMKKTGELDDLYLNLKPLLKPEEIPFDPHCYITARPVSTEITMKWLEINNFPSKNVYTVEPRTNKAKIALEAGVEIFIDDSYDNFLEMNREGITTYLFTRKHNERFNVGHLRINTLKDLPILL